LASNFDGRKQKCGGFTQSIKCRPCTTRKVKCSFEEEVKDPRHNPYLCLRGSPSPSIGIDTRANESTIMPSSSSAQSSGLTGLDRGNATRSLLAVPPREIRTSSTDEELPKQIEILKARFVPSTLGYYSILNDRSRIAELEKWFVTTSSDSAGYLNTPQSRSATSLGITFEPIPSPHGYSSPPVISWAFFPPEPFRETLSDLCSQFKIISKPQFPKFIQLSRCYHD
jgi:hypothetical protein